MENSPQKVLRQFRALDQAVIDASSIIYMRKAGYLKTLAAELCLLSPEPVIDETGYADLPVRAVAGLADAKSNDQLLVAYSLTHRIPVISEDKKILMRIRRARQPYFNSLMMLNFLLFRKKISTGEHGLYFAQLIDFAWYGKSVLEFSQAIFRAIQTRSNANPVR